MFIFLKICGGLTLDYRINGGVKIGGAGRKLIHGVVIINRGVGKSWKLLRFPSVFFIGFYRLNLSFG